MTAPLPRIAPRIAVVIPCYNSEDWITRTISSVFDQAYADLVLVVVDDGSKDASADRVRAFGDRVILHTGPNRGACAARNTGMAIAAGQGATHVIFLDADDYLEGPMLASSAAVAAETGADIVLSDMHIEREDGSRRERFLYSGRVEPIVFFEDWLNGRYFNPSAILWRLDFVERLGGWDETLSRNQDMDISLRAMFEDPLIMKNDRGVAIHTRLNPTSVSQGVSYKATESRVRVLTDMVRRAKGTAMEPLIPLMLKRLYLLTREIFAMKQREVGRMGVAVLNAHGYVNRVMGSRKHRFLVRHFGLENAVRILGR